MRTSAWRRRTVPSRATAPGGSGSPSASTRGNAGEPGAWATGPAGAAFGITCPAGKSVAPVPMPIAVRRSADIAMSFTGMAVAGAVIAARAMVRIERRRQCFGTRSQ